MTSRRIDVEGGRNIVKMTCKIIVYTVYRQDGMIVVTEGNEGSWGNPCHLEVVAIIAFGLLLCLFAEKVVV